MEKLTHSMKTIFAFISTLLLVNTVCLGQNETSTKQGKITFLTSSNAYVKFDDTSGFAIGDTLNVSQNGKLIPALIVKNKSSTSIVCEIIKGVEVQKEDAVEGSPRNEMKSNRGKEKPKKQKESKLEKANISGRISAAGYSNISSERDDTYRTIYRLSLNANRINDSKFSFETYLNYRQNFVQNDNPTTRKTKFFNVFNMALKYEVDSTLSITLGRKINNKASTLWATDGLQLEKNWNNFYSGLIVGFRPDISDFSLDTKLLQYGAYLGFNTTNRSFYSQTTLGYLEQKNAGKIDRQYVYFQHSSSISRNLSLFSTFELDLYNVVDGASVGNSRLTNFLVSANYKISKKARVNLSYGSRKRILFFETFASDIEQLLAEDEARQKMRLRVNLRPWKNTSVGITYSKRFQSNSLNKSDNINGFITLSKIPNIKGRLSANINVNTSNYFRSKIISIRHARTLIKQKLNADFYYRFVNYDYLNHEINYNLNYVGSHLTYRYDRKLSFSLMGEMAVQTAENNYRINIKINKRF